MTEKNAFTLVDTASLIPNRTKKDMYQTPENYSTIKKNILKEGIVEPLLVNKKTNEIISGNLRLQIAIELGIKEIPVNYIEIEDIEMDIKSISTNQQRVKSISEILKEITFFEEHYKIKKGQRTDLNPELKKIKEDRDELMKTVTRDTREKIKLIDKMATDLYGKESKKYKSVFRSLDNQKTTLNGQYQALLDVTKRKHNESIVPKEYDIKSNWTTIYNKSSEDMFGD